MDKVILLVEDNPDDEALTLRAGPMVTPGTPSRIRTMCTWR
jgi:hypothetical protein